MTPPFVRAVLAGRRRWYVLGAAVVVVAAVVWVLWPRSVTVAGAVVLGPSQFQPVQGPDPKACSANPGYGDVREGAEVVVTDAGGKTLGVGQLGVGRLGEGGCRFGFAVRVPGSDFYGVQVSRRGVVRYSGSEVREPLVLSIG